MMLAKLGCSLQHIYHDALQEKSGIIEQLEKQKQMKGEQMQQAHADLARQAALLKDLQGHARGKKEAKPPGVSPEQVCALHNPRPTPRPPPLLLLISATVLISHDGRSTRGKHEVFSCGVNQLAASVLCGHTSSIRDLGQSGLQRHLCLIANVSQEPLTTRQPFINPNPLQLASLVHCVQQSVDVLHVLTIHS